MDLPEVRDNMARFLELPELAAAALVCKSWNTTFTTALYRTINRQHYKRSNKEGVISNADRIRHLELSETEVHLFSGGCTKLKSLTIRTLTSWSSQNLDHLYTLIRRNPSIKSIRLEYGGNKPPKVLLEAVSSCLDLCTLDIWTSGLDVACMGIILDTAVRLECLRVESNVTFPESLDKWQCFPVLRELNLSRSRNIPARTYLKVIRRCPGLRNLIWLLTDDDPCPVSDICELFRMHCPLLERLELSAKCLMDENLSEILDSCHQLVSVKFTDSKFGELSFRSLFRHFATLQEINLEYCNEVTSEMVQRIMTSCERLTSLHAPTLDASDILGDVKGKKATGMAAVIHQPLQEWACRNLRLLSVFICGLEGRPLDWHRKVLQRLSKLTKLVHLNIGSGQYYNSYSRDGLDLRLETGLDALSSLKQLRYLGFDGSSQQMEEQDVQWIEATWPGATSESA
ncbi:hypothetical protein BGX34_009710 [Mortierella sp. NVP85]|nr:hypothetical protein BGX34_009710 [Mortierella sp. NVP85]